MTRAIATSGSATGSRLLAELLERVTSRVRAGEPADFDVLLAEYPEHAEELRRLMPAVQLLADLSHSVDAGAFPPAERATGLPGAPLGDYRLIREVGRGGMGVVYEAEQISLGRRVALKVLPFAATMDPRQLQRFYNEAKAAASLHHEHIVPVYAVGCERGVHYYAMQFIDGTTLAQTTAGRAGSRERPESSPIEELGALTQPRSPDTAPIAALSTERIAPRGREFYRRAAELIADAADALEYAHAIGVVHRDVKPTNLLLDVAGKLWVADFGLARFGTDAGLTMTGDMLGTLRYMAPEQALAKHNLVDQRADIYGLGATLYELLTGHPAIGGEDRQEILRRIAFEEPVPPRKLDRSIPADLETIALKCLAKELAERYASAGDMAADLRRWLDDKPIQARLPGQMERLLRWVKRRPAIAALTAVSTLALIALATFAVIYALDQRRAADRLASEQGRTATALASAQLLSAGFALDRGQALCDEGDIGKGMLWMARALELAPPDAAGLRRVIRLNLECWRWHLTSLRAWLPLDAAAHAAAFSDDGRFILTGDVQGTVRIWDARTFAPVGEPLALPGWVHSAAFSSDGQAILTFSRDDMRGYKGPTEPGFMAMAGGTVRLWKLTPTPTRYADYGEASCAALSPDSRQIATGQLDGTVRVLDAATGAVRWQARAQQSKEIWSVAWRPDGRQLLTGATDGLLRIYDATTGKPAGEPLRPPDETRHAWAVAWRPDGNAVAAAHSNFYARIWNVEKREIIGTSLRHNAGVTTLAFSPEGRFLVTGSGDDVARVWDGQAGRRLSQPLAHDADVCAVACSPDGRTILTSSADKMVRIWDALSSPPPRVSFVDNSPDYPIIALSPDGRLILMGGTDGARIADTQTGEPVVPRLTQAGMRHVHTVAFTPDGRFALTATRTKQTQLWDVKSGRPIRPAPWPAGRNCAAISPDGQTVLTGDDGAAQLWKVASGEPLGPPITHSGGVSSVAFSLDGHTVATGSDDGTVRLWDVISRHQVGEPLRHSGSVCAIQFDADGQRLVSAIDGVVYHWDLATGNLLSRPFQTDLRGITTAFAPDGRWAVHMTSRSGSRFRDIDTGRIIGPPVPHSVAAKTLSFRADSRVLAAVAGIPGRLNMVLIPIPEPVADDAERIKLWVQTLTGMELERDDAFTVLDRETWQRRRQQLEEMPNRPPGG